MEPKVGQALGHFKLFEEFFGKNTKKKLFVKKGKSKEKNMENENLTGETNSGKMLLIFKIIRNIFRKFLTKISLEKFP